TTWERAQGLAADVEAYGQWMRDEAERRIGHLYPDATGPNDEKLTPIAWIWARTVESPDPSWNGHVPLVSTWILSKKKGKPIVWAEPVIDGNSQTITYQISEGGTPLDGNVVRGNATCIATGAAINSDYIKEEGLAGRLGNALIAVVGEGKKGRRYCSPTRVDVSAASVKHEGWRPSAPMSDHSQYMATPRYGMDDWHMLFTDRQMVALTTFVDLLQELRSEISDHAAATGLPADGVRLRDGGKGADAYTDALVTYLAFNIDRCAGRWNHLSVWNNVGEKLEHVFRLNAFQMTWVHAEGNPFSESTGNWMGQVEWICKVLRRLPAAGDAEVHQSNARDRVIECAPCVVSTDPPYYDNVPYSDLADFFHVWLRKTVGEIWPDLMATIVTPKTEELVADNQRHGGKSEAKEFFENGMTKFMIEVAAAQVPDVPTTIFYAYKATEIKGGEVRSTGWDTFLQGVLDAGLAVTATWPVRTEMPGGTRMASRNVLSGSIVLACRPRSTTADRATRSEFVKAIREELPGALETLRSGNITPVDFAQSAIGPGIKVFSQFAKVVEADGSAMPVRQALVIINDIMGEVIDGAESDLDEDTRFSLTWYAQYGYADAPYGDADNLARAKNTSIEGVVDAGIAILQSGKLRLLQRSELDADWTPVGDDRLTVWEATQYLVAALERSESEAAELLRQLGGFADRARQLAYVLFQKATDKGWADEASVYNGLITAWPVLQAASLETPGGTPDQATLL
ncbi:MAG: DUF1156 domain-containing protein, partial [Chloroflexi bacterium]|nr:DUF1156 domain-containing protein [Chloroflexota bacterium]